MPVPLSPASLPSASLPSGLLLPPRGALGFQLVPWLVLPRSADLSSPSKQPLTALLAATRPTHLPYAFSQPRWTAPPLPRPRASSAAQMLGFSSLRCSRSAAAAAATSDSAEAAPTAPPAVASGASVDRGACLLQQSRDSAPHRSYPTAWPSWSASSLQQPPYPALPLTPSAPPTAAGRLMTLALQLTSV
eukprot:748152-Hanusia_phi.AAC.1